jgi:hypothetical protein
MVCISRRLVWTKWGILQLSIVHPVLDVLGLILMLNGLYEDGEMTFNQAYPYLVHNVCSVD